MGRAQGGLLVLDLVRAVVGRVAEVFNLLGIRYAIGGSLASGIHGIPRTTNDADLIADVKPEHVDAIVEHLGEEFYTDRDMIADAVRTEGSFNLIHYDLAFKVDVYVCGANAFRLGQLARRVAHPTEGGHLFHIASAEDTVVAKLHWYRLGGETSERQWRDVIEVLAISGPQLDMVHLRGMADELAVADLLQAAVAEAER
jgi:hypothetical protein